MFLPVKVFPAKQFSLPGEALLVERPPAVEAPDALRVPRLLHHRRHELVVDGTVALHAAAAAALLEAAEHGHGVDRGRGSAVMASEAAASKRERERRGCLLPRILSFMVL